MRVLAIDPGPHVGIATWDEGVARCWEEEDPWEYFDPWIRIWADEVVIESFIISGPRAREANETIEMIGVVRYLCRLYEKPLTEQSPADARTFSTREKLEKMDWWERGGSDHARSASKHLLLFLARRVDEVQQSLLA